MKFRRVLLRRSIPAFICFLFLAFATAGPAFGQKADDDLLPDGSKSDGCTLIGGNGFKACCVAHDRDYFLGGSWKDRFESDKRLYECVRKKKSFGAKLVAPFIWLGVRIGGVPFLSTPFRWGFGKLRRSRTAAPSPGSAPTESPSYRPREVRSRAVQAGPGLPLNQTRRLSAQAS